MRNKNPLHTRVITSFKDKNYNYFLTSRFNAEHIFTAIDEENFTEDSSKRLTTKILQVRRSRRKFLSKVRVTHTEGNPAQGPLIISTREIPLQRSKQHCSLMEIPLQVRRTLFNEENIYYNLLPTVYYYNYILFIFSQVNIRIRQGIVVFRGSVVAAAHHFAGVNSSQFLRFSKI